MNSACSELMQHATVRHKEIRSRWKSFTPKGGDREDSIKLANSAVECVKRSRQFKHFLTVQLCKKQKLVLHPENPAVGRLIPQKQVKDAEHWGMKKDDSLFHKSIEGDFAARIQKQLCVLLRRYVSPLMHLPRKVSFLKMFSSTNVNRGYPAPSLLSLAMLSPALPCKAAGREPLKLSNFT